MAVTFAPLKADGNQLIDGVHDIQVSDSAATQVLTALGLPTTVPGQAPGQQVYGAVEAYIVQRQTAGANQQELAMLDRIRIAVAAGWRIETGIIAWR